MKLCILITDILTWVCDVYHPIYSVLPWQTALYDFIPVLPMPNQKRKTCWASSDLSLNTIHQFTLIKIPLELSHQYYISDGVSVGGDCPWFSHACLPSPLIIILTNDNLFSCRTGEACYPQQVRSTRHSAMLDTCLANNSHQRHTAVSYFTVQCNACTGILMP